jgi:malate dehydrogenase (oxaloacetate-decarboxylating)(NADP+)
VANFLPYAEGKDERVLRAAQVAVDEGLARPTLIERPEVKQQRVQRFGRRRQAGRPAGITIR